MKPSDGVEIQIGASTYLSTVETLAVSALRAGTEVRYRHKGFLRPDLIEPFTDGMPMVEYGAVGDTKIVSVEHWTSIFTDSVGRILHEAQVPVAVLPAPLEQYQQMMSGATHLDLVCRIRPMEALR